MDSNFHNPRSADRSYEAGEPGSGMMPDGPADVGPNGPSSSGPSDLETILTEDLPSLEDGATETLTDLSPSVGGEAPKALSLPQPTVSAEAAPAAASFGRIDVIDSAEASAEAPGSVDVGRAKALGGVDDAVFYGIKPLDGLDDVVDNGVEAGSGVDVADGGSVWDESSVPFAAGFGNDKPVDLSERTYYGYVGSPADMVDNENRRAVMLLAGLGLVLGIIGGSWAWFNLLSADGGQPADDGGAVGAGLGGDDDDEGGGTSEAADGVGTLEVTDGDDDEDRTSTSTSTSTLQRTSSTQPSTTAGRRPTTNGAGDSAATTERRTSTTRPATSTTRPTTTTRPATSTTRPTTTTAPVQPVRLEGRAVLNGLNGRGTAGVRVEGYSDLNGDGSPAGEVRLFTADTGSDGWFSVTAQPGCYALSYIATGSGTIEEGYGSRSFCVESGQTQSGLDTLLVTRRPRAPMVCYAESSIFVDTGVAVVEWSRPYGDEYYFYDRYRRIVARTSELPPWVVFPGGGQLWERGFDTASVYSAARVVDGVRSDTVTVCED